MYPPLLLLLLTASPPPTSVHTRTLLVLRSKCAYYDVLHFPKNTKKITTIFVIFRPKCHYYACTYFMYFVNFQIFMSPRYKQIDVLRTKVAYYSVRFLSIFRHTNTTNFCQNQVFCHQYVRAAFEYMQNFGTQYNRIVWGN